MWREKDKQRLKENKGSLVNNGELEKSRNKLRGFDTTHKKLLQCPYNFIEAANIVCMQECIQFLASPDRLERLWQL